MFLPPSSSLPPPTHSRRVYLGPFDGRPTELRDLVAGVLTNPNCEYTTNFVAIHTLASWVRDGPAYDPVTALQAALQDWLPLFRTESDKVITIEDITLLSHMFYLPYSHGQVGFGQGGGRPKPFEAWIYFQTSSPHP